jgi:Flp pilus assembly secretin CpaC
MSRSSPFLRRTAIACLFAAGIVATAAPAAADDIEVIVDRAKVFRIAQPADVVIIGNPAIADATIQDSQTLIITGRSYGTTNLIVLDASGAVVADEIIAVGAQDEGVVTVYRRDLRESFACNPTCSPMLAVGDSKAWFDSVNEQIQAQIGMTDEASGR